PGAENGPVLLDPEAAALAHLARELPALGVDPLERVARRVRREAEGRRVLAAAHLREKGASNGDRHYFLRLAGAALEEDRGEPRVLGRRQPHVEGRRILDGLRGEARL